MSNPLQTMPELRAIFESDAGSLIDRAAEQLAALTSPTPDYTRTLVLRNTIHSLRGAAAMVGARELTLLIDDYERLLEVAESFKLTAVDQARQAYQFLNGNLARLGQCVKAVLDSRLEEATRHYTEVHHDITAIWGGYFYSAKDETNTAPAAMPEYKTEAKPELKQDIKVDSKPDPKAAVKAARPAAKSGPARRSDPDAIARDFLSSLGVAAPASAPASTPPPPPVAAAPRPPEKAPAPVTPPAPVSPAPVATEQIDPEMLSYFILETNESLAQIEGLILAWEKNPADAKTANSVFRLVHTIKGAANSLGMVRIGRLLHGLEDLLESHVVDRVFPRLSELVETIFGVTDIVKALVREAQTGVVEASSATRAAELTRRIQILSSAPLPPARPGVVEAAPAAKGPAKVIPMAKAAPQAAPAAPAAPPVSPENTPAPPVESKPAPVPEAELHALQPETKSDAQERMENIETQTIRVDSDRLDLLMNLIGELVISRSRLEKKLTDISRLKEEMFFGKTRLFQAITDFQARYEYTRPTQDRNRLLPGGAGLRPPQLPGNGRRHLADGSAIPAAEDAGGFSELEFDQYDDFNILARTLMEIGTDTGEIFSQLNRFFDAFGEETGQFSKITARLQDEITRVRMMPLTLLFQRLQRATRDAANKEQKQVEFATTDNDTRLDKLIIDRLYTPLLHIVRNAVSHGIEAAAERGATGKPAAGLVHLRAACEANQVVIEVSDDGRGLNLEAIRATAIRRRLLPADAKLDDETLTQLIFQPGFSTATNVTDVSGRGVGLDVVRQEIARLSGTIHVRSTPGEGCTFVIHLPLTLAIHQAMFISAGGETCALPLNFVERILEHQAENIVMSGQQELVGTDDGMVPLLRLNQLFNLPASGAGGAIVLARVADRRVAIGVDRILRKQDIVVKPLGPLLRGHPLFSGATLGGDGQVVMIVDLPRLLETEQSSSVISDATGLLDGATAASAPARPLILVVDDSLSVRKVIEKHLHSFQYQVELAVDGLDALEKLRTLPVSLVLTDLEMPRMHGFELIAEMRRQEAFREVPVIVVTSRDADKHRRRATALGANDYIIKPFSREQLAEHISRTLAKPVR
jgi:chemosensory pili system protein ChpA (sensor histidine kinase/response regulator)